MNIQAISVFIQVDGQKCFAPIQPEFAELFMRMLPAFQHGDGKTGTLLVMPEEAARHVEAAGQAIGDVVMKAIAKKGAK